jgi:hypothetical protein
MFGEQTDALVLALLVLTMGLAGCAGDAPDQDASDDDGTDGDEPPEATTPRWSLGDEWSFTIEQPGFPTADTSMIVYNQTADRYRLGVTDQQQAFVHALFDVNPFLGRLQKGNIGVFEDGEPRAMFDFPLTDGKTWTTEIFIGQHGGQLEAEATYNEAIDTEIGEVSGYEIEATNADGFTVRYDFVPEVKWLTHLEVTKPDDTQVVEMTLTDFEANATGTGYFVRGRDLTDTTFEPEECTPGCSETVLVDGTESKRGGKGGRPFDLVAYNVQVDSPDPDEDKAQVEIRDGNGSTVYSCSLADCHEDEFSFEVVHQEDFAPGEWQIDASLTGEASARVQLAGGFSFSGTVE